MSLEQIAAQARACRICVEHPRGVPLPHEPRPVFVVSETARILIAGQAPGNRVNLSGVPFEDNSGDRLRDWMGVSVEEFYDPGRIAILPMGFCFPGTSAKGGDLPPRKECAPAWREPMLAAMPQVRLVLLVGLYAQAWHLGSRRGETLTETVLNWRSIFTASDVPKLLPLPHPSWRSTVWMRKNPLFESELLPFLRQEVRKNLRH